MSSPYSSRFWKKNWDSGLEDIDPKEFEQYEEIPRFKMPELDPKVRASNFKEVETGFEEEDARAEADRCLECGCNVNETCDLRNYATEYKIDVDLIGIIANIAKIELN